MVSLAQQAEVEVTPDARPGWRPLVFSGWGLFVVSFFLPALSYSCEVPPPPPPPPPPASATAPEPVPTETAPESDPASPVPPTSTPESPSPASVRSESASSSRDGAQGREDLTAGWQAFWYALMGGGGPIGIVSALTNLLMVATGFHRRWPPRARWPAMALAAAGALNLGYWLWWVADRGEFSLKIGYYVWVASFLCAAVGFRLRGRRQHARA